MTSREVFFVLCLMFFDVVTLIGVTVALWFLINPFLALAYIISYGLLHTSVIKIGENLK